MEALNSNLFLCNSETVADLGYQILLCSFGLVIQICLEKAEINTEFIFVLFPLIPGFSSAGFLGFSLDAFENLMYVSYSAFIVVYVVRKLSQILDTPLRLEVKFV